jgi:hypothetical protein
VAVHGELSGDAPQTLPAAAHALRPGDGGLFGFVGYEPAIIAGAEAERWP